MLESSGYTDIKLEDWSDRYLLYLQQNLTRLRKVTPTFGKGVKHVECFFAC